MPLLAALACCQVQPESISIEELLREATVVSFLNKVEEEAKAAEAEEAAAAANDKPAEVPVAPAEEVNLIELATKPPTDGPVPADLSQVPVVAVAATVPTQPPNPISPLRQRFRLINRKPFRPRPRPPPPPPALDNQVDGEGEEKPSRNTLFQPRRRFRPRPFLNKKSETEEEEKKDDTTTTTQRPSLTGRRRFTGLLRRPRPTVQILTAATTTTEAPTTTTTTVTTTAAPTTTITTTTLPPTTTNPPTLEPTTTAYFEEEAEDPTTAPIIRLVVHNPRGSTVPDALFDPFATVPSSTRARQGTSRVSSSTSSVITTSTRARRPQPQPQTAPEPAEPTSSIPFTRTSQIPFTRTTTRRRKPVADPIVVQEEVAAVVPPGQSVPFTNRQRILANQRARQRQQEVAFAGANDFREAPRRGNKIPRRLSKGARRKRPLSHRRRKPVPRQPVVAEEEVEVVVEEVIPEVPVAVEPTVPTAPEIIHAPADVGGSLRPSVQVLKFSLPHEKQVLLEPVVVTNRFEPKQIFTEKKTTTATKKKIAKAAAPFPAPVTTTGTFARFGPTVLTPTGPAPALATAPAPATTTFAQPPPRETTRRFPSSTVRTQHPGALFTFQSTFGSFEPATVTVPVATPTSTSPFSRIPTQRLSEPAPTRAAPPPPPPPSPSSVRLTPTTAAFEPVRRVATAPDPANLIDPPSAPLPTRPSAFSNRNTVQHNLPRKFEVTKPAQKLRDGDRVKVVDSYRTQNDDGSLTWGYKSADGSFKEETIGADCVTRGRFVLVKLFNKN